MLTALFCLTNRISILFALFPLTHSSSSVSIFGVCSLLMLHHRLPWIANLFLLYRFDLKQQLWNQNCGQEFHVDIFFSDIQFCHCSTNSRFSEMVTSYCYLNAKYYFNCGIRSCCSYLWRVEAETCDYYFCI